MFAQWSPINFLTYMKIWTLSCVIFSKLTGTIPYIKIAINGLIFNTVDQQHLVYVVLMITIRSCNRAVSFDNTHTI